MLKQRILAFITAVLCVFVALFDSVSRLVSFIVEGSIMAIVLVLLWMMIKDNEKQR